MPSKHIFMFPFRWDYQPNQKSADTIDYDVRTNLNIFNKLISTNQSWTEVIDFEVNNDLNYNERTYFYPFVRNAIFPNINSGLTRCYNYNLGSRAYYNIYLNNGTHYELEIDNISLHSYDIGIGVLSYHLSHQGALSPDEVLKINDYGRRIYPQFLGNNFDLNAVKSSFLADKIHLIDNNSLNIITNFISDYKANPDYLPEFILGILGTSFKSHYQKGSIRVEQVLDDRMFVVCWYASDNISQQVRIYNNLTSHYNLDAEDNFWYRFTYVDTSLTCPDAVLRETLIENSTYKRWLPNGTLFGVSRYSFVMLTDGSWFPTNILSAHLSTIYFRLVLLVLVQRAFLLRFSGEIAYISRRFSTEKKSYLKRSLLNEVSDISDQVGKLYKTYIAFNNKLFFKEITPQEQGIELYDLIENKMRIPETVVEVEGEIERLNNYLQVLTEGNSQTLLDRLSLLGGLLLVPGFIFSYLSLGILDFEKLSIDQIDFKYIRYSLVALAIAFFAFFALPRLTKKNTVRQWGQVSILFLILFIVVSLISAPLWKGYQTAKKQTPTQSVIDSASTQKLDSLRLEIKELRKSLQQSINPQIIRKKRKNF